MNAARRAALLAVLAFVTGGGASCSERRAVRTDSPGAPASILLAESAAARERVEELRARFVVSAPHERVIGAGSAARFERTDDGHARAVFAQTRAALTPATVALALRATGDVTLEDDRTHVALKLRMRGASDAPLAVAGGLALYPGALGGADVVHRPRPDGTEDFVVFETRPAREEIAYDVDVSRVAGLRLVSNTLEFLDAGGTPRLRVAPPYVVDARGARHDAAIAVDGCAYDTNAAGPWGRPVTAPGATSCGVRVVWASDVYPAIVDPAWTTTGSMTIPRSGHTATLLNSGKVLITGGCYNCTSAELFDGTSSFAATGSMTKVRSMYTATLLPSGQVLIAGGAGTDSLGNTVCMPNAELFDGTSTFTATGSMKVGRYIHTATLLKSGKVLVAGGENCGAFPGITATAELFSGSSFTSTGSLTVPRVDHTATLLGSGKVLIAGGTAGGAGGPVTVATAELFDGVSSFAPTGSLSAARSGHVATLLPSGKVLVTGGIDDMSNPIAAAETFDGVSSFAPAGSMLTASASHGVTVLGPSAVLITGVAGTNATELFDGASTFVSAGPMTSPRDGHTATLLGSGKVLAAGGMCNSCNPPFGATLASAELYALVANGGTCTYANECISGVCDDGICCSGPCNGTCQTCTAGTGACVAVKSAADPDTCAGVRACDAAGACKLVDGQPSANPAACLSGFVSDGVCCNTACSGACDACTKAAGGGADGTCAVIAQGSPGNPACGAGYVCDGVSAACPSPCVGDVDCAAGFFCSAGGACVAQHTQGQACDVAAGADCKIAGCRACATGNCVDGVCCDTACTTVCYACAAALKESGPDGTCGPVALEKPPPRSTCLVSTSNPCGADGKCSGAGACLTFAPTGAACGVTTCSGGSVSGSTCDGNGTCVSGSTVSCSPYACAGSACATSCASDADCSASTYCSKGGACVTKAIAGAPCTAGRECATGFCADGFCCDSACSGQCEACNVAGARGTCIPASGAPLGGRAACGGAGTPCAGACDGKNRPACAYPDGLVCGKSCAEGQETEKRCNMAGICVDAPAKACPGNIVACDGDTCKTGCAADSDCAQGFGCASGKCLPLATATCDGAHTVKAPNGTTTDCAPYNCEGDHCKLGCASINDCVEGNACDPSGQCVPISSPTGSTGGCALAPVRRPPTRDPGAPLAVAIALAAALARRRRGAARDEVRIPPVR